MKYILLLSCLISSIGLSKAQSPYQQAPGSSMNKEGPLSAMEAKMLRVYYEQLLKQKESLLQQETQGRLRAEGFVKKLNDDKDAQANTIFQLQDSLSILKRQLSADLVSTEPTQTTSNASYRPATVTVTDKRGVRRSATTTSGGGYIYSEISTGSKSTKSTQYHTGPKGGCFYYSGNGSKVYVNDSLCK